MLKKEIVVRKDGVELIRTFSDEGFKISKIGTDEVYDEAVDIKSLKFEYIETDEKIGIEEGDTNDL